MVQTGVTKRSSSGKRLPSAGSGIHHASELFGIRAELWSQVHAAAPIRRAHASTFYELSRASLYFLPAFLALLLQHAHPSTANKRGYGPGSRIPLNFSSSSLHSIVQAEPHSTGSFYFPDSTVLRILITAFRKSSGAWDS